MARSPNDPPVIPPVEAAAETAAWTEQELLAAVNHGLQREAFSRILARISAIKDARSWADYYAVQADLLADLLWAQEYMGRSRRNAIRTRKGKPVLDAPESGSWELDRRIAARVERQFRSIGDTLAWRLLGCRRHVFWVLSQNAGPGLMYGKEGLKAEVREVEDQWRQGRFALLTDLTQSLRIGDLIVFANEGPQLVEVKTQADRMQSSQRRRVRNALSVLNRETPLHVAGEPHEHFEASTQMKCRLSRLKRALVAAKVDGFGSSVVKQGWVVMAVSLIARNVPSDVSLEGWVDLQNQVKTRGGVMSALHVIQSMWSWLAWDLVNPFVGAVPFGAYPFEAQLCAELTCGYSMFRTVITTDLLDAALRAQGFATNWRLARAHDAPAPNDVVVSVARRAADGMRGISVQASAFNPVLYEFLEPERYASALREMFDWSLRQFPRQTPSVGEVRRELGKGTLALSNESAIWFKER